MRAQSCGRERVILVTGAGGLIGGALGRRLVAEGIEVLGTRRSGESARHFDLDDPTGIDWPEGISVAFLCAWRGGVGEAAEDPQSTWRTNVEGNMALIQDLKRAGAKVVFLSTSLVFSGEDTGPGARLSPCCLYGQQKVTVEAALDPRTDAIVRITKVGETLLPRMRSWAGQLRAKGGITAAQHLRVAPVMLDEVVSALSGFAVDFQPGIYQMSASKDHSYRELAGELARKAGYAGDLVADDPAAGANVFAPFPQSGRLTRHAPTRSRTWPAGDDCTQLLVEGALS